LQITGSGTQLVNGFIQDCLGQGSVSPIPTPGSLVVAMAARPDGGGYWLAAQDGTVAVFNLFTPYYGSMVGQPLDAAISAMCADPAGTGYWLAAEDGGVFAFGAGFHGSAVDVLPAGHVVVGIAPTPTGDGYWLVSDHGEVYAFGDAGYHGGGAGVSAMVDIAAMPTGDGYLLLDESGHVYAFGTAVYAGNGASANAYAGIATRPSGGYWLCDNAGNVEGLGGAVSHGAPPDPLNMPMTAIAAQGDGGYWTAAEDGGVFAYGTAPFDGSMPGNGGVWQAWTLAKLPGRMPTITLKNRWRIDATMRTGQPGLQCSLQSARSITTTTIYGDGTDDQGHAWRNTKYPNLRPITPPLYPGYDLHLGMVDPAVEEWTSAMAAAGWRLNVGWTFDGVARQVCTNFQVSAGLEVTGTVNAQTWAATFVTGSNSGDLTGAYIAPLASLPEVEPFLYDAFGAITGPNPAFDPTVPRVERWESMGEHVNKPDAIISALAELTRDSAPGVWGTLTLYSDPNEKSRYDLHAGENFMLQDWEGADVMLHIAQRTIGWNTQGRPVTLTVDTNARDLITLASVRTRDRSTTDPVRRVRHSRRASRIISDKTAGWDFESGGGLIPQFVLQAGVWSVVRIPAAETGSVVGTNLSTTWPGVGTTLTPFAIAVFAQPVTPAYIKGIVPNPLAVANWPTSFPAGSIAPIAGWGDSSDACGYSPGQQSAGNPLTGQFSDNGSWDFTSLVPPWLWVALWSPVETVISGQL
jgi:hypothetical protein